MDTPVWRRRSNRFKGLLDEGDSALALWVTIPWPSAVEIAGAWGVDAALIDMEHTTMSLESAERMIVAAELAGVTPVVRPPGVDAVLVGRLLDAGAQGVLFPRIEDGAEAAAARKSLRHAPDGTRGWGGAHTRHAMWQGESAIGGRLPADRGVYTSEYIDKARSDLVSLFLVETVRGVENIEEILDLGKPDAVDFGRGDFSAEVGFDDDACDEAFESVLRACRARGIGINVAPCQAARLHYPGCYSVIGLDALLLSRGIRAAVDEARAVFSAGPGMDGGAQS